MTLDYRELRTVDQIAAENPAITRNRLRWWIYEGERNGFDICVVRIASWRALSLWAGADGSYQRVEAYSSQAVGPRVDLELGRGPVRLGAYWVGDGGKVERVLGIRARAGRRASCVIELERIEHTEGSGRRAVISALWRL